MKINGIDIQKTITDLKEQLSVDTMITPSLKATINVLLVIVSMLCNRLGLNSKNSNKPPSSDPNRTKKKLPKGKNKPGGQKGYNGTTLEQRENPDIINEILIDPNTLPPGEYTRYGIKKRQVFDLEFKVIVTEYQAEIVINEQGQKFTASFPEGVTQPVQYGVGVKAHAIYLSQHQLLPYERIREYFTDQLSLPISSGTLYNFNIEAYECLQKTKALDIIKQQLKQEPVLHADETGINVNKKGNWLHVTCSAKWSYFYSHDKRGKETIDEAGVLPDYQGILVHDHWKPYFHYPCQHALCHAHHLRELEYASEHEKQSWAKQIKMFLQEVHNEVNLSGGRLGYARIKARLKEYNQLIAQAEKECPAPVRPPGKKGRMKKSKSRNLLERLRNFKQEILRFMINPAVPFTNNQGERDIRMTKVHQKVSGCFRSETGARIFCAIRSYISSCRKQNISASVALGLLLSSHLPDIFTYQAE